MQLLILGAVFFGIVFLIVAFYGLVNREALEASETAREQLRAGGSYGSVAVNTRDHTLTTVPSSELIMALCLDPRLDLTKTYWLINGISG